MAKNVFCRGGIWSFYYWDLNRILLQAKPSRGSRGAARSLEMEALVPFSNVSSNSWRRWWGWWGRAHAAEIEVRFHLVAFSPLFSFSQQNLSNEPEARLDN